MADETPRRCALMDRQPPAVPADQLRTAEGTRHGRSGRRRAWKNEKAAPAEIRRRNNHGRNVDLLIVGLIREKPRPACGLPAGCGAATRSSPRYSSQLSDREEWVELERCAAACCSVRFAHRVMQVAAGALKRSWQAGSRACKRAAVTTACTACMTRSGWPRADIT